LGQTAALPLDDDDLGCFVGFDQLDADGVVALDLAAG
jgi:hypothetical protein